MTFPSWLRILLLVGVAAFGAWWVSALAQTTASPASLGPPEVNEVAVQQSVQSATNPINREPAAQSQFIGNHACNTTGCHGATGATESWRNTQGRQMLNDPHSQAFRVLFGERALRMYERLEDWPAGRTAGAEKPTDEDYDLFLRKRCVNCHATPSRPSDDPAAWRQAHLGGVSCESCHGPAAGWLTAHYRTLKPAKQVSSGFGENRAAAEFKGLGFNDLKHLPSRAQVCVGCHVGPMGDQDMNHDLIAAGHPRLAFEFNAYLTALPAHWARDQDEAKRAPPGEFHRLAWSAGQFAMAEQTLKLLSHRRNHAQPEFASYDCFDCHHQLGEPSRRQSQIANRRPEGTDPLRPSLVGTPRLNAWPLLYSRMLSPPNSPLYKQLFDALQPEIHFRQPGQPLEFSPDFGTPQALSAVKLREMLEVAANSPDGSWDRLIQAYLAVYAFSLDLQQPQLNNAVTGLGEFLAFHAFPAKGNEQSPSIYDSPGMFRELAAAKLTPSAPIPAWNEAEFQRLLSELKNALPADTSAGAP